MDLDVRLTPARAAVIDLHVRLTPASGIDFHVRLAPAAAAAAAAVMELHVRLTPVAKSASMGLGSMQDQAPENENDPSL